MISSHLRHGAENGYLMASKSMLDRELLSLRELTEYASVSERTLREWLHRSTDALPAVRFDGKILVSGLSIIKFSQTKRLTWTAL